MVVDPKYSPLISIVPLPEQAPELRSPAPAPPSEEPLPDCPDTQEAPTQEPAADAAPETTEAPTQEPAADAAPETTEAPPESANDVVPEAPEEIAAPPAADAEAADTQPQPEADPPAVSAEPEPPAEASPPTAAAPVTSQKKKRSRKRTSERKVLRKNRILFLLVSSLILLVVLYSPTVFSTLYENTVEILTQVGILEESIEEPYEPFVLTDEILSEQAILIDLQTGRILAEKDAERPIPPASMTKIMTLMTAVEQIEDLDDTFTMTQTILNTTYDNDLVIAGFMHDETVPVRDLLYGLILPSGADAAFGLSSYLAALDIPESERSFSEIMNEKAAHYGLSSVHFSNSTGMFEETHQASLHDVAVILWFAMQDDTCRDVLTTVKYTTTKTEQHPEGIELTNQFLLKIAEEDCGSLTVIAAKTGFVDESGRCAASYAVDESGHTYICVTAKTESYEEVIADHALLYTTFIPGAAEADDAPAA